MASSTTFTSIIPSKLFNLMNGFCASQALFAACDLGIFDALHEATHPQSAKQLSEKLSTDHDATSRLLNVLVNIELLNKHSGLGDQDCYSNNEDAQWLISTNALSQSGAILNRLSGSDSYGDLTNLSNAVRDGSHTQVNTHDKTFKIWYADEKTKYAFLKSMRSSSSPGAPFLVSVFDLSEFKTMCDLGGAIGDVAYAACNAYPDMKITVLELPEVVQCAAQFKPSKDECPNQHNVTFKEGDFVNGPLPTADLYVLARILHNWGDEKVDLILKTIYNCLPSGGGLLIGELLLNDDKTGPFYPITCDLIMLVTCERGARERTGKEYKTLLEKHGFIHVQYKSGGTNSIDAVFAIKP